MIKKYKIPETEESEARDFLQPYVPYIPDHQYTLSLIESGLYVRDLEVVMRSLALTTEEVAGLLHVNPRTIMRLGEPDKALKPDMGERVACLLRLIKFGRVVLGSNEHLASYIKSASMALDGMRPLDYLGTILGMEIIFDELGRIDHGVY